MPHATHPSAGGSRADLVGCRSFLLVLSIAILAASGVADSARAQLAECDQISIDPNDVPGGCIAKRLFDQIGAGQGDQFTPGSSIYLIGRDPARSIRRGRQLFQRKFTEDEGQGPRVSDSSSGDITANRALGAGLADSCAACHGRPRGAAGHGGDVATRPDSRDAPHLFGLGIVEQLADEMTADLRAIRQQAIDQAQSGGQGGVLLDADFDSGTDGFVYLDDALETNNPAYASGQRVEPSPGDGVLRVKLGNKDDVDIFGMSGGWTRSVEVPSTGPATLSFRFQLDLAANYESDEFAEARVRVGAQEFLLATLTGDGNGGQTQTTGHQEVSIPLTLAAGTHTLTFAAFNNKKTLADEFTVAYFNNVLLVSDGTGPGPVTLALETKGVEFGAITAHPDGSVDTSAVEGVNEDLRVRPFFHQGGTVSMREFIIGALKAEMGLEAFDPILCAVTDPVDPQPRTSPSGFFFDPALDAFERPPVCDTFTDGDGDGVADEVDAALVDHLEFYLLNYFKPGRYATDGFTDSGEQLMSDIGCTSCHVRDLVIDSDRRVADVETIYDPVAGIFNDLFAVASTQFDVVDDGEAYPLLVPQGQPFVVADFFSDLKRHDLGPAFHERDFDGSTVTHFVTEPLWGVGTSAPYGHDGRSINLDAVIRRHGGEAQASRDAYVALTSGDRMAIQAFLQTLVLFPPDDTASNLNPGDPNDPGGIQSPAVHGNINLGALFQIPEEGPE